MELTEREQKILAVLEQTYPGWRIHQFGRWWWATKTTPPTGIERSLGVIHQIARPDLVQLGQALSKQHGILTGIRSG
ncbi:hypothetical protein [Streptosporangium sp. KLBMP 9127]|nr:hypothetical protein [Streptosporangium sp. KLBMP 9127]